MNPPGNMFQSTMQISICVLAYTNTRQYLEQTQGQLSYLFMPKLLGRYHARLINLMQ